MNGPHSDHVCLFVVFSSSSCLVGNNLKCAVNFVDVAIFLWGGVFVGVQSGIFLWEKESEVDDEKKRHLDFFNDINHH